MIELFVEGKPVDINEGFSTLLTLSIDDIKDFGAKNTTFSKTIVLPGTKRNNALFGNIFDINGSNYYDPTKTNIAANFNPAIGAKAYIFADNMQIFKGIIRMLMVVVDDGFIEYEVAVFGELGGFVAKLGNKKLEELDFSAYDLSYSLANIVASWDNTPGSGVYFPLMDYGNYSVNKHDWSYRTFRPALYAKEYIDKIFAGTGYTYDCAEFNSTRFKKLVHPHNQKLLTRLSSLLFHVYNPAGTTTSGTGFPATTISNFVIGWTVRPVIGVFTDLGGVHETFQYTGPNGIFNIDFRGVGTFLKTLYNVDLTFNLVIGATTIASFHVDDNTDLAGSFNFSFNSTATILNNDIVSFSVTIDNLELSSVDISFDLLESFIKITATNPTLVPINIGENITINDSIPKNILQKEYFSSILKLYNMYVFEDYDNEKLLKIQPFIDYYADATAVDWSNKVDRSRPMKYKPMGELSARYYEFKFKDDSDYYNDLYSKRYNKNYGSYKYDSEYEFVNESVDVDLIFAGTPLVGYSGEDKAYSTILKQTGTSTIVEENIDSCIRILQTAKITGVSSWAIKDGATTLGSYTDYGYAGHFDDPDVPSNDIQFGVPEELFFTLATGALNVNQFNVYWSSYMAEITDKDSKLLSCTLRLYAKDVYQLNFAQLIYIDGCLLRINKIADYNATNEDTCEGEFLKVINRIY